MLVGGARVCKESGSGPSDTSRSLLATSSRGSLRPRGAVAGDGGIGDVGGVVDAVTEEVAVGLEDKGQP